MDTARKIPSPQALRHVERRWVAPEGVNASSMMNHCRLAITDAQADLPWRSAHGADLRAMLVDHEPVEEECIADEGDGTSIRFPGNGYESFSRALTPAKSCEARR